jgi:hypothetical protein
MKKTILSSFILALSRSSFENDIQGAIQKSQDLHKIGWLSMYHRNGAYGIYGGYPGYAGWGGWGYSNYFY